MKKIIIGVIISLVIIVVIVKPILAQTIPRFERGLEQGMAGDDIKWLQVLLNRDIDTRLTDSGPGSSGSETSYFGPLTKRAVIRFQEKYSQDVLAPWGFTSGTGYVGQTTREKLNSILGQPESLLQEVRQGESRITGLASDILARAFFGQNLKLGMALRDVKWLQVLLNRDIDTRLTDSGPGSSGSETSYFGPLTKRAVIRFQEKYSAHVLAPWGFTSGTGYVGTTTRQKLNLILDKLRASAGEQEEEEEEEPVVVSEQISTSEPGLTISLVSEDLDFVASQALAPLAKFTFTNGDDQEVKITNLKFKRIGVSSDSTLTNIYLFEGVKRLTNAVNPLSNGVISFAVSKGIITIPAGQSKTITIKSDLNSGSDGELIGVSINSADDIVSNASSLNASFPIKGDLTTIDSVTLAEVDFNSSTTPTTNSNVAPKDQYVIWQNTINVPISEINLTRLTLTNEGTIVYSDLENFRLYVNGVQAGTLVESLDEDGCVTFDLLDSPKKLEIGSSTIKVSADIIGGSSKTFRFSLENAADVGFTDIDYGINILATANNSAFTARESGTQTISTGSVTITEKTDGPVDVVNGISAETIGEFILTAGGGERVKIQTLEVEVLWVNDDSDSGSVGSLRDGIILADGNQVGRVASLDVDENSSDSTGTSFSFGSLLILEPNEQVTLQVKVDIYDNDGTNHLENDDTLQVNILAGSSNARGLSSNSAISVPASAVTSHTVEIEQGELDLFKYGGFINKTLAVPVVARKIAQFSLMSSHEAVDLDTIIINLETVAGAVDASDDLSNLYIIFDGNSTSIESSVVDGDNTFTINHRLEKHTVLDISVYADVALSAYAAGTNTIIVRARVSGSSVESGASAVTPGAASYRSGQTITFGRSESGDLVTRLGGNTPLDRIAAGSSEQEIAQGNPRAVIGAKYEFTAVEDSFLIKTIKIELDDFEKIAGVDVPGAVLYAVLKDENNNIIRDKNGNESKEKFGAGTGGDLEEVEFTGLELWIPADTSKTLTFELLLAELESDGSSWTSQSNLQLQIKKVKYENSLGEEISDSDPGGEPKANHLYVYRSIPSFTYLDTSENKIYNSTSNNLYRFKVGADYAGPVSLKQLKFALTWDDNNSSTLVLDTFRLKRDLQEITSQVTIQDIYGNSLESIINTATPSHSVVIFSFDDEETIPAGEERTYDIYARPTGFQTSASGDKPDILTINLKGGNDTSAHNTTKRYLVDNSVTGLFELHTTNSGDGTAYDLIWSDRSAIRHSFDANNAYPDWANSYLMSNLPLDAKFWHGQ